MNAQFMYHLQPTIPYKREGSEDKKTTTKKKNPHLYGLKEDTGMLNEEQIELLLHTLNSEMLLKYKGKPCWST